MQILDVQPMGKTSGPGFVGYRWKRFGILMAYGLRVQEPAMVSLPNAGVGAIRTMNGVLMVMPFLEVAVGPRLARVEFSLNFGTRSDAAVIAMLNTRRGDMVDDGIMIGEDNVAK